MCGSSIVERDFILIDPSLMFLYIKTVVDNFRLLKNLTSEVVLEIPKLMNLKRNPMKRLKMRMMMKMMVLRKKRRKTL